MGFRKHLFISYTHIDNQKLEGQDHGWVSRLHNTLAVQLEMRLGEKAEIWRDNKLAGNDNFSEEIISQFDDVGLLVSVISPRYINSDWCKREAYAFCKAADSAMGVQVGRKSRIFKVYKLPVENLEGLPDEFCKALGFPFYKLKDDVVIELDPAYGTEMVGAFNLSIAILAQKLAETVRLLRQPSQPQTHVESKLTKIYLSETGWDLDPARKMLEAELSNRGYSVIPDHSLSSRETDCEAEIEKMLDVCQLSIHMFGGQPGMVPSGPTQKSVDILQNQLAATKSKSRALPRIIWMPPGALSTDSHHRHLLDLVARSHEAQFGADVVTGDFETLKSAVLGALQRLRKQELQPRENERGADERLIYVICDRRDTKATVELRKLLRQRGFDPQRPTFEGGANSIREQNGRFLDRCRAVIVYYGAGDESWYDSTLTEIKKLTRMPAWTYIAAPATSHKQELLDELGQEVINGLDVNLPETDLDRIIASLQPKSAAGGA